MPDKLTEILEREIIARIPVNFDGTKPGNYHILYPLISNARKAILALLPKENYDYKFPPIELNNEEAAAYLSGHNSVIAEIKSKLSEEGV